MNTPDKPRQSLLFHRLPFLVSILIGAAMLFAVLMPAKGFAAPALWNGIAPHVSAFALLVFPISFGYPKRWLLIELLANLFGIAIETLQPFLDRPIETIDAAFYFLGVALGVVAGVCTRCVYQSLSRRD